MVAVQAAIATAVNAVDEKYTWKTLVEFQSGGSFTLPDDATWALFLVFSNAKSAQLGSLIYRVDGTISDMIIPMNNNGREIWSLTNSGRTFTFNNGDYQCISVYYR